MPFELFAAEWATLCSLKGVASSETRRKERAPDTGGAADMWQAWARVAAAISPGRVSAQFTSGRMGTALDDGLAGLLEKDS